PAVREPRREDSEADVSEIPPADWSWIDAAAQRFERAWKAGPRPRIEDDLAEADESRRPPLLEQLLRVECGLRREDVEGPAAGDSSPPLLRACRAERRRLPSRADTLRRDRPPRPPRRRTSPSRPTARRTATHPSSLAPACATSATSS